MRGVVVAKMFGLVLLAMYLVVGLTRPPVTEGSKISSPARALVPNGEHQSRNSC